MSIDMLFAKLGSQEEV
jgi:hypothetical protein